MRLTVKQAGTAGQPGTVAKEQGNGGLTMSKERQWLMIRAAVVAAFVQ